MSYLVSIYTDNTQHHSNPSDRHGIGKHRRILVPP